LIEPAPTEAFRGGLTQVAEARQLADDGRPDAAERLLRGAVDADDPSAAAIAAAELGSLLNRRDEVDEAIEWWELAVASGYSAPGALAAFNLGVTYERRGQVKDAEGAYGMAVLMGDQISAELASLDQENPADAARRALTELETRTSGS
jgi:tetratricopeptide (TPR) repeat protein